MNHTLLRPSPPRPSHDAQFRSDLPRWRQLVTADWLARLLAGERLQAVPAGPWCLFEVGSGAPVEFLRAHIPGAAYLNTEQLERGPYWNKLPDAELLSLLLSLGIRHDSTVILYGRNSCAAARAAHLLLYAGVSDVRLLDGGYAAWQRRAGPTAAGAPIRYPPQADFGRKFPACPQYLSDLARVQAVVRQPSLAKLVSIRSWDEHIGLCSGYSYIEAKGDIPGARWGRAGSSCDVNSMSAYQHADGTLLPAAEIRRFWAEAGVSADSPSIFYCGTGWRASLAFFYAWLMGYKQISVFDGGWLEWSSQGSTDSVLDASPWSAPTKQADAPCDTP
ncbi:sulfurtransferase [Roseateles oligotrophus]|uniref:Sulfurtransferase n=1 Tax=Roseateles oligotrophus TaxID=1769250 RepID=A0ABT2YKI3_9BURK|nr:rhodanese-like domain-containing protein [Roseateles oligotrophus]MCV2370566.1 sulfurtransferase [Roseateles oligotrophus]